MTESTIHVSNCPFCGHFPTQHIASDTDASVTEYRALAQPAHGGVVETLRAQVLAWIDTADWEGSECQSVGDKIGEARKDGQRFAYQRILKLLNNPSHPPQPPARGVEGFGADFVRRIEP